MTTPGPGDVVLCGSDTGGFSIRDAATQRPVATGLKTVREAVDVARAHGAAAVWQQSVDGRGRRLGPPTRLPLRAVARAV